MIVTCEKCATQFHLDDAKVPAGGIRVRCSRCTHAFFVESPHRPDTQRADDLAREALAPDSAAAAKDQDASDFGLEDGESDWQFNEEIDRARAIDIDEGGLAAAQEAVDDLLGSSSSGSVDPDTSLDGDIDLRGPDLNASIDLGGSDLDLDLPEPPVETIAGEDRDLSAEPAEDPNDFVIDHGVALEGSPQPEPAEPAEPAAPVEPAEPAAPVEPAALAEPVEPAEPGEGSLEAGAAPDAAEASDDSSMELGSLDDWALLADDVAPESPAGGTPIGRLSRPIPEEAGKSSEATAPARRDAEDGVFDAEPRAFAAGATWISRARSGVAWALVTLLCACAVIVGLWPGFSASEPVLGARPVAGLEAEAVRGRWIENAVAGPIYVIGGSLRASSSPWPTGSLLRIRLLDADGAPIAAESAAVGPPVSEAFLREWNLRDLRGFQEAGALRLAWRPLAPGERWPFHAILGRVPSTAAAFEFQVVAAASPVPEPDAGADIPYPTPDLAAEAMVE